MCVIASKPAGVDMPDLDTITDMWYTNPDGAGFMYADKGTVHIRKGFMELDDYLEALEKLKYKYDLKALPLVMHFRITTHGGTKPENCHPFPITDSLGMLKKLDSKTKLGVAHNGIIHITPRKDISDTMEYVLSQLAPLHRAVPDFYKNKHLMEMVYNAVNSKLAFLTGDGEIYTVGDFHEKDGVLYSNLNHTWYHIRNFKYSNYDSYGYNGWDYYDDGEDYTDTKIVSATGKPLGAFVNRTVMWIDDDICYVSGVEDFDPEYGYYAIDALNNLYIYDDSLDALLKLPGATAYYNTGVTVRFNSKSPAVMREIVYESATPALPE